MKQSDIFDAITKERSYQDTKWGAINDTQNTPYHWASYISAYTSRSLIGVPSEDKTEKFKADMIKVAALAVAALERLA